MSIPPENIPNAENIQSTQDSKTHGFLKKAIQAARRRMNDSRARRANQENEALLAANRAEFQEMLARAKGLNKKTLEIIQTANEIPSDAAYAPLGTTWTAKDGQRTLQRVRSFSLGENKQDPARDIRTPLLNNGSIMLHLDSRNWSHNGFRQPLENATITVETPYRSDSNGDYIYDAPHSLIVFNDQPYNPDSLEFDDRDTFTGKIRVLIDGDGQVTVERSSSTTTRMIKMESDDILFDVNEVLEKILSATTDTVLAYRALGDEDATSVLK